MQARPTATAGAVGCARRRRLLLFFPRIGMVHRMVRAPISTASATSLLLLLLVLLVLLLLLSFSASCCCCSFYTRRLDHRRALPTRCITGASVWHGARLVKVHCADAQTEDEDVGESER